MPDLPRNPWAMPALDGYSALFARAAGGRVRRSAAVAIRLGAALHPRRVAGPAAHSWRQQPALASQAGGDANRHRGRYWRGGGQLHDGLRRGGGHRGASRRRL